MNLRSLGGRGGVRVARSRCNEPEVGVGVDEATSTPTQVIYYSLTRLERAKKCKFFKNITVFQLIEQTLPQLSKIATRSLFGSVFLDQFLSILSFVSLIGRVPSDPESESESE